MVNQITEIISSNVFSSVAEQCCRKINFLSKFWYQKAVHETTFTPLWHPCSDGNTWWQHSGACSSDGKASQAQHSSTPTWLLSDLLNFRAEERLQSCKATKAGCLLGNFQHALPPAKRKKPVAYVQPTAWSTQHWGTQNPRHLPVSFHSPVTLTSKHIGHLWPLKPIQSSRKTFMS